MADPARRLDAEVRRVDEDRWLASRFAPRDVRARLTALYALNYEIARTAEIVSEPGVGLIRLSWWRDGVSEVLAGVLPRRHAVLAAVSETTKHVRLDEATLLALIEARAGDLEAAPFTSASTLESYIRATAGGLMQLALEACGVSFDQGVAEFTHHAGLAWGIAGVLRAEPYWRARGRRLFAGDTCSHVELIARARDAYAEAHVRAGALPSNAFPAVGYVTLAPAYLRALEAGRELPTLLARQVKLIAAAASGRV